MSARKHTVDLIRRLFSVQPLRAVRDGMLRLGERLDPTMSALSDPLDDVRAEAVNDLDNWAWHRLDEVYIRIRRSLRSQTLHGAANWRYAPDYTNWVAHAALERLAPHARLVGGSFMELGCGQHNPLGVACVMFLNGAAESCSFDRVEIDPRRTAEGLYDLLADCALRPTRWHWTTTARQDFMDRVHAFNAEALQAGDLEKGLGRCPVRYLRGSIDGSLPLAAGSIDVMTSQHVLEHFLEFPAAARAMCAMMKPGAVAYHDVDLVDHRVYGYLDPVDYRPDRDPKNRERHLHSPWSFLTEPEEWRDPVCNRLRKNELLQQLSVAGFEVVESVAERAPIPSEVRAHLSSRFAAMSDDDLETVRLRIVVRKKSS